MLLVLMSNASKDPPNYYHLAALATGRSFNLIITLATALGGEVILHGRDSALRDLSSIHGNYRAVQETDRAIQLVAAALLLITTGLVRWLLD